LKNEAESKYNHYASKLAALEAERNKIVRKGKTLSLNENEKLTRVCVFCLFRGHDLVDSLQISFRESDQIRRSQASI